MSTRTRRTETAAFPATEASVGEARRWLSKILDGHPRCDDAALLLSEAATNALVHTDSPVIGVTVAIGEGHDVRIDVADEGAETVPSMPSNHDGDLASSGRGIRLIRALSSRWGFTEERPQCVLWFVLSAPREAEGSGATSSTAPPPITRAP
ncbi:ATP-binding protein [Sphaerisporangium sp. NPDC088356]|uniref:ATP-binding protein n=1 Tax=Sphaerisporangium sp. NPDC088356 TaxID=3154871 RepID=UPI003428851B